MRFLIFNLIFTIIFIVNVSGTIRIDKNYRSHRLNGNQLLITTDKGIVEVLAMTPTIIRVALYDDFKVEPDSSYSVILKPRPLSVTLTETKSALIYATDSIKIVINKSPVLFEYYKKNKLIVKDTISGIYYLKDYHFRGVFFSLRPEEALYGIGSRSMPINRRNQKTILYNVNNFGYEWKNPGSLNLNVPLIVSSRKYAVYFDSPGVCEIKSDVADKNVLEFYTVKSKFAYYFISDNNLSGIYKQYTELTGRQPMPPRWGLGYFQSRAYYHSWEQIKSIVAKMRADNFPLDVIVLDATWYGFLAEMGNMTWDTVAFHNHKKVISDFLNTGIHIIPVTQLYVSTGSIHYQYLIDHKLICMDKDSNVLTCRLQERDGFLLHDLTNPNDRKWFGDRYKDRTAEGVSGWWCDGGEPDIHPEKTVHHNGKSAFLMHNIYSNLWLEMLFNMYKHNFPQLRPFFMVRAGWGGIQRFGAFPLCGDEKRSWNALKAMLPVMLGASMSGISYLHTDIGGFAPYDNLIHNELYVRWFQLGTFSPVMRAHMAGPIPSEPIFYDEHISNIVRKYIHLRYSLLPYNYTLAYQNTSAGLPIMKPVNFYEPENVELNNINDEYLWGKDFLVAPVLDSLYERQVKFPAGSWVDWFTHEKYEGHTNKDFKVPLSRLLLFVRSGSIIPTAPGMFNTKNYNADSLIFYYFTDLSVDTSNFVMYNDDGKTPGNLKNGNYELLNLQGTCRENQITFNINHFSPDNNYTSTEKRNIKVCFVNLNFVPGTVKLRNRHIPVFYSFSEVNTNDDYAVYIKKSSELWVNFDWENDSSVIEITNLKDSVIPKEQDNPVLTVKTFPNPFFGTLKIRFSINKAGALDFKILSLNGELVRHWNFIHSTPGNYELSWNGLDNSGKSVSNAVYFLVVKLKGKEEKFIMLLKVN